MQPYYGDMSIKMPYVRKKISTLLTLSAAAIALMLTSPMLFFNVLLQPVQAQTSMTFRTPAPTSGNLCTGDKANLTFDAQGTPSSSNPQHVDITSGTFQVTNSSSGQIMYSGSINDGSSASNVTGVGWVLDLRGDPNRFPNTPNVCAEQGDLIGISTLCSTAESNQIIVKSAVSHFGIFLGAVECSQGGGNTAMTGTTTTQDSDGDGIPDSSDKCTHNSNPKCFMEAT